MHSRWPLKTHRTEGELSTTINSDWLFLNVSVTVDFVRTYSATTTQQFLPVLVVSCEKGERPGILFTALTRPPAMYRKAEERTNYGKNWRMRRVSKELTTRVPGFSGYALLLGEFSEKVYRLLMRMPLRIARDSATLPAFQFTYPTCLSSSCSHLPSSSSDQRI